MNRATFGKQGKWAAMLGVLVIVGLAGCASDSMDSNSGYTSSGGSGSGTAATGTGPGGGGGVPAAGTAGAGTSSSGMNSTAQGAGSMGSTSAQASYGVVQAIDPMSRDMNNTSGIGVSGAAAAGGTMSASAEPPYRITVRMDDGTSQSIVVDTMPPYKIGDRVRYMSGVLSAY
ncbi:UNVERIFIED_ORG: hypothetical protein JN05_02691 [Zoogloea ramigera]|uniref:Lipoprotein n=1 Tax=Duganella zoogloeoides TaxID=75659 RepID=A0ABZ0XV39_9BURK|nr:hypothetical protein [Duganella zoogloeoides]WQH03428.1 hypothetical protein SR858_20570 [Duganella zoogloeoides]